MRKTFALVAAFTVALIGAGTVHARPPQTIYVQNISETVTDAQLADALPAFQVAVTEDFAPAWGVGATLALLPAGMDPPAGSWLITVDNPQVFMYGFHDLTDGLPVAYVFAEDSWQITFTHELFEMLGNPYLDRANRVQRRLFPFYIQETGDPVEDNQFAYTRPSPTGAEVSISDFVLPAWFRSGSVGPWDFRGYTRRPLQILRGGYQIAFSKKSGRWVNLCFRNIPCV